MILRSDRLNYIRGKASVSKATPSELRDVFQYIDYLEGKLDHLDLEDFFGTEGWRHFFEATD